MISKVFEGKTDLQEEWYGTEYSVSKISPKFIEVSCVISNKIRWFILRQVYREWLPSLLGMGSCLKYLTS